MRPLTGTDIIDFHNSGSDLLVLTPAGDFMHVDRDGMDGRTDAYSYATTEDGDEVQILLEASTIDDGEWFPDALDDDGNLIPSVADEMAGIINQDGILAGRIQKAREAGKAWKRAADAAEEAARYRAETVCEIVAFCGGNQSQAARLLDLDQSTVNKLVKKARTQA